MEGAVINTQKKIFDAIAAASIFTNCAGIDTNNSQVITMSTFTKFLETRQMEVWTEEQVKALIYVSKLFDVDIVLLKQCKKQYSDKCFIKNCLILLLTTTIINFVIIILIYKQLCWRF